MTAAIEQQANTRESLQAAIDESIATSVKAVDLKRGLTLLDQRVIVPRGVSLYGSQAESVVLKRVGTDPIALEIQDSWWFALKRFSVANDGPVSDRTGLLFTGSGVGTRGGSGVVEQVLVSSFKYGVRVGVAQTQTANSEMLFTQCRFSGCETAALLTDFNTLDIRFEMLQLSGNGTGVHSEQAGSVHVDGGSASKSSVADFRLMPGGVFSINGYRSEHSSLFLSTSGTQGDTQTSINDCEINHVTGPFSIKGPGAGTLIVRGGRLSKPIGLSGNPAAPRGHLLLEGVAIQAPEPMLPFYGGSSADGVRYWLRACHEQASNGQYVQPWPDEVGVIQGGIRVPSQEAA